jgi:hypothetical protein
VVFVGINVLNPSQEHQPLTLEDLERLRLETRAALERARADVEHLESRLFALKLEVTQHLLFPPREPDE